ncbi:hypothetical protein LINPERHAP1_LOCUS27460 [Linum perenne]
MPQYYDDEVEEYDDYEDDGEEEEEEEEEYEEVEERKPTAEEMEFLNYRERRKELIRRKRLKESGASAGRSLDNKKKLPLESFGSFFGPSQPVIAPRVIQERKTLLENPHIARRIENPQRSEKRSSSTAPAPKNGVTERVSTVKKELQTKVQKLKNTRDYSFLLSDDADVPAPARVQARPAQVQQKSKQPMGNGYRHANGAQEQRKPTSMNGQPPPRTGSHKATSTSGAKPNMVPADSRRQPSTSNGIGPGRPAGPKGLPPKPAHGHSERKAPPTASKTHSQGAQRPPPSRMPSGIQRQQEQRKTVQEPSRYSEQRRLVHEPNRQPEHRKVVQDPSRSRPMAKQQMPPARPQMNKPVRPPGPSHQSAPASRMQMNRPVRPPSSSHQSAQDSRMMKRPISRHSDDGYSDRHGKPVRRPESRPAPRDDRPKKRPARPFPEDDDDDANALRMIRQMFKVDRYAGRDDDDSDMMEANFDDIMEEEKRSAKIARKEDEEQLRLIEEEERRERMRREKRRKLNH